MSKRLALLTWVFFVHLAGIYLFTGGFLLTRLALPDSSSCNDGACTFPPTHKRAIVLIIDALRFDFVSPNPPVPSSPFHHDVLTLPQELTHSRPKHSFLFNAYADPPTTTLQRIKGLTTGSLPTFVDVGSNFGGASILEDSIIKQLKSAGKRLAFMGDDTWMSVFPDSFDSNMTFPFDSFNVEDLHTVDEGVLSHIFPLLKDASKPFDFLVGHFLGVDHVGHRLGPDHPSMKSKLQQMNQALTRVVDLLDEDTLLVVLGDHGMDRSGDHGGDGELETSSAMWIYSKGPELFNNKHPIPSGLLRYTTFPKSPLPHRAIQQIDILPTLSLLLGLPIPFNNLGAVIPELFWGDGTGARFQRALELNTAQVERYLNAYRSSPSGGELDDYWKSLKTAWTASQSQQLTNEAHLMTLNNYISVGLLACRSMWAQFNPFLMGLGLSVLSLALITTFAAYSSLSKSGLDWEEWLDIRLRRVLRGIAAGAVLGLLASLALAPYLPGIDALDCILFASPLVSSLVLLASCSPAVTIVTWSSLPIILILHTVSFFSNSFLMWEDRIVPFLAVTAIVPHFFTGIKAPTSRLRYRIVGFSLLFAACVRLMSFSTVCREEQQPYCHTTFYSSTSTSSPLLPIILAIPSAIILPSIITRILGITRSDSGLAKPFIPLVLRPALLLGATYWLVEWLDSADVTDPEWKPLLRLARTWAARAAFALPIIAGGSLWWFVPICLGFQEEAQTGKKRQMQVFGYANAFGSPYLLFWSISLAVVYVTTQLTGQLVLGLFTIAILSYLETLDSVRDVKSMEAAFSSAKPSTLLDPQVQSDHTTTLAFSDCVPLALLGIHAFFGTGHQATISSIQWKSAFMLTPSLVYPYAPSTVITNSLGSVFLVGLAAPLLALWNRAPLAVVGSKKPPLEPDTQIKGDSTLSALGLMIYYESLLLGSAISAAILRRHLMVWKVFAPRFMLAALELLVVDVAVLFGVGVGVARVGRRISGMFRGTNQTA